MVVLSFFNFSIFWFHFLAMFFFSWLPDIDSVGSPIGRLCKPLSRRIHARFGHRGFFHSLLFLFCLIGGYCFLFWISPPRVYVFCLILYISFFLILSGTVSLRPGSCCFILRRLNMFSRLMICIGLIRAICGSRGFLLRAVCFFSVFYFFFYGARRGVCAFSS